MNPEVVRTDREFKVKGYLSATEVASAAVSPGSAAVGIDAVRATTTATAVLARGARYLLVVSKSYGAQVDNTPIQPDVPLVCGGEQSGMPIPGGLFGNSALDVPPSVAGKDVRFYSSNSGRMIEELTSHMAGAPRTSLYLASLLNLDAVASAIEDTAFEQLLICGGGFYDRVSLEDAVAGGRLIKKLGLEHAALDDGATTMVALADKFTSDDDLLDAVAHGRVGRTLSRFGRTADIAAAITGAHLDPQLAAAMRHNVVQLTWLDANTPVFETYDKGARCR